MATPDGPNARDLPSLGLDWAVRTGIDVIGNVISGGPKGPTDADKRALEAAGYVFGAYRGPGNIAPPPDKGKFVPVWFNAATGDLIGNKSARGYAGRNPRPTPDIATPPLIPSIPLPAIPPLIGALPWPVIGGPIVAGGLMWPTAAGAGSDLRDLYGMPKPKTPGGRRRGRRRRARARPRALPGRGNPFPAAAPGRGGSVTIRTRPSAPAAPPAPRTAVDPWKPSKVNLPPVKLPKQVIQAPAPARVPMSRTQTVIAKAGAIAKSPWFGVASSILNSPLFNLFQPKARAPSLGQIVLPGTGNQPGLNLNPLTALNAPGLQYSRALNPAAVSEQDCSCRPARKKRKGKPCKNPVTSRRSFKRDGSKFITVTRKVKCQASSRKKPALRPVP